MKVKRSRLKMLVVEELRRILKEAPSVEDGDKDRKSKEKDGGKGEKSKIKPQGGEQPPKQASQQGKQQPPAPGSKKTSPEAEELSIGDDPSDPELDQSGAAPEDDLEGGKNDISDELAGKSVQSITMDPKSKLLPGSIEIVITFDQTPEPFKILVPKSGIPKFFWKNSLHNEL